MKRREFLQLVVSSVGLWRFPASAQEPVRVVGFLSSWTADVNTRFKQAFRQGLNDTGFVDGQNVSIEYREVEAGEYNQLPKMASDLVERPVEVLFASAIPAAMAAKTATSSIPIVFAIGSDPVDMGLATSLNRPGGNATGVTFLSVELTAKRLELLRQIVPKIASLALLVNQRNPTAPMQIKDIRMAAANFGLPLTIENVNSPNNLDDVFSAIAKKHADALIVSADSMFLSYRDKLAALAKQHAIPTIYFAREFVTAGGLISYSPSFVDSIRKAGTYVGRILKGEKAADLPILQPTNFEIVINLKTAKALGLTVPPSLLARADEVIE